MPSEQSQKEKSRSGLHARVHGVVQGVGFRYSTVAQARRWGLRGYARNMSDGSVEVFAEGTSEGVEKLLSWLGHGPPSAVVTRVDHQFTAFRGIYRNFGIEL